MISSSGSPHDLFYKSGGNKRKQVCCERGKEGFERKSGYPTKEMVGQAEKGCLSFGGDEEPISTLVRANGRKK